MAGGWAWRAAALMMQAGIAGLLLAAPAKAADDPVSCGVFANKVKGARSLAEIDDLLSRDEAGDCPETSALARVKRQRLAPPPPPSLPPPNPPPPDPAIAAEKEAWVLARDADNLGTYQAYLRRFPNGANARIARQRIAELTPPPAAPAFLDARTTPATTRAPVVSDPSRLPDFALFRECENCPEMVVIPAGSFLMGSPAKEVGRDEDEDDSSGPGGGQVNVRVPRFAISRFETTWAQWDRCVADGGCQDNSQKAYVGASEADKARYKGDVGYGRGARPVINVDWNDAGMFARWVNNQASVSAYRRPSEAEWEYAARAGMSTRWSFGDVESQLGAYAWFASNASSRTQLVGGKAPNPWGLFDMHGNVWEWVEDCYRDNLSGQTATAYATPSCSNRVSRGGSSFNFPLFLSSAYRKWDTPTTRFNNIGFRVARTLN